ncbi:MAG: TolC family protein [Candidatus Aminicenantes bacterium]|nr:TolC family protein [Candidatus Aminicenantes bacterium]
MRKKNLICFLILTVCVFSSLWALPQKQKNITLEECIVFAIKNNLDVTAELITPEIAQMAITQSREKFLPALSFGFTRQSTNSTSFSFIESSEQVLTTYNNYSGQISQMLPTGGQLNVSLNTNMYDTSQNFLTINPRYGSTLDFSFSQPLLRNFGIKTNRREIIVAQNNRDISENDFRKILLDTVFAVEDAYWNLVYSVQTLEVKRQSLELAQDLLHKSQKEVEIGTLAPKEILSAQAEVAAREADILQADTLVKNNIDRLKTLINFSDEEEEILLIPSDEPAFELKDISLEEAFHTALENRPDLFSSRINLKNRDLDIRFAWNQLLPALNLNANYWSPGLSGDQILYLDNNPFTNVIVGTIPGGAGNALKDALNFKYQNWSLYFTLDVPLNSIFSRAALLTAKKNRERAEVRMKSLEQKAFLETKTTIRTVKSDYLRVEAYKIARELAEQKLEAEESKLRAGMTTNFMVLQYQRDLANAKTSELRAVIDYNLSLSRLNNTLGISLKNWNINLTDAGSGEGRQQ